MNGFYFNNENGQDLQDYLDFLLALSCHCLNMQLIKNIGIAEIMLWPNYPPAGGCCFRGFIWKP